MVIWSVNAKNIVQKFIERSEALEHFSKMGRVVPEIDDGNIRELILNSYRLLYKLSSNESRVEVLAIIHGRKNFSGNID